MAGLLPVESRLMPVASMVSNDHEATTPLDATAGVGLVGAVFPKLEVSNLAMRG